jgi:hypothetical protein
MSLEERCGSEHSLMDMERDERMMVAGSEILGQIPSALLVIVCPLRGCMRLRTFNSCRGLKFVEMLFFPMY